MNFTPIRSVLRNKNDHVCLFNGLSPVRWQQNMRKATSTRITNPTISPAVVATLHAEADKLDHKALSRTKREPKRDAEAGQARSLAVGIASTSENTTKSTSRTSDNEFIPSTKKKEFAPGSRNRAILQNLSRTLLSSLVKGGISGVQSLKAWLEDSSVDGRNKVQIRSMIDRLSAQSTNPNKKNKPGTIKPHAGTSKIPTPLAEGILNHESTRQAISPTKAKKCIATDVAPISPMAQSVTGESHISSTIVGDNSTAPEGRKQRKQPSVIQKIQRGKGIARRISSLRIRRVADMSVRALVPLVRTHISSAKDEQEVLERPPSASEQIQVSPTNQILAQSLARPRASRPRDKQEVLERPLSASEQIQESPTNQTLAQALARPRASRPRDKQERAKSLDVERRQKTLKPDIKQIDAADLSITPVEVSQPPVPSLSYGLERVLFNPGVYHLQDPRSRVFNFDPYLQTIMPVSEFDFSALKQYVTSSLDTSLINIAEEHGKRYIGSSSSMTGILAHFHFLLSQWREINTTMMSQGFPDRLKSFTLLQRCPSAIFLKWKHGTYAIDADKEFATANILSMLGKSMEKLLTLETNEFERYRKSSPDHVSKEERDAKDSFHYSTMGDFLMRSQLDAYDSRLPGTGMFDLKTRAVVTVRMDTKNPEHGSGYEIKDRFGEWASYEREYYDMIRSAFLKYSLQVRMGRMDGIFVAFHNTERIFGFQYVSLGEMDFAVHGQYDTALGDQEFKLSLDLLNKILDRATKKFPQQSIRIHFETREAVTPFMYIFAEPMTEEQVDDLQSRSNAHIEEFEREILGLPKAEDGAQPEEEDNQWETIQAMVQKAMDNDELGVEELSSNTELPSSESAKAAHDGVNSEETELQGGHDEMTTDHIDGFEANGAAVEQPETNSRNVASGWAHDKEETRLNRMEGDVDGDEIARETEDTQVIKDEKHKAQADDRDGVAEDRADISRSIDEQGSLTGTKVQVSDVEDMTAQEVSHEPHFFNTTTTQIETGAPEKSNADSKMEQDDTATRTSKSQESSTSSVPPGEDSPIFKQLLQALAPSKSASSHDLSDPQSPTPPPAFNATADASFLNEIAAEHTTASKTNHSTVLAMTLTIRNKVDNKYVTRPMNLVSTPTSSTFTSATSPISDTTSPNTADPSGPSSKWSVEYTLADVTDQNRAWALYKACQERRRKKLDRAEEEDDGDQEGRWYFRKMRELAAEGKKYRRVLDEQDDGRKVVVLGGPDRTAGLGGQQESR